MLHFLIIFWQPFKYSTQGSSWWLNCIFFAQFWSNSLKSGPLCSVFKLWHENRNLNGASHHVSFAIQIVDAKSVWHTEESEFWMSNIQMFNAHKTRKYTQPSMLLLFGCRGPPIIDEQCPKVCQSLVTKPPIRIKYETQMAFKYWTIQRNYETQMAFKYWTI